MKKKKEMVVCDSCGKKLNKSEALSDLEPFAHEVWGEKNYLYCCDDDECLRKFEKKQDARSEDI